MKKTLQISTSGIRGLYPKDLNPQNAIDIIHIFNRILEKGPIALARDNRSASVTLFHVVLGLLRSLGREVHVLNMVPTPTIKHYIAQNKLVGGIMLSASHNPINWAAYKFIEKHGSFFSQSKIDRFQKYFEETSNTKSKIPWQPVQEQGKVFYNESVATSRYVAEIFREILLKKPLSKLKNFKVALDTNGGSATNISKNFFNKMGISYISMFPYETEYFPREPEPSPQNLKAFGDFVKENNCDIGFAFDPDADRLVVVDETGTVLSEEYTLILVLLIAIPEKGKIHDIVINLSSSYLNQWVAKKFSCSLHLSPVGEVNVIQMMNKKKAILGGEGNGGVIDLNIASKGRDAFVGIAWILLLLSEKKQTLSSIVQEFPQTTIEKLKYPLSSKTLERLTKKTDLFLKNTKKDEYEKITSDGLYVQHTSGLPWIHIRTSNTEPIIRVIIEAKNNKQLKSFMKNFISIK